MVRTSLYIPGYKYVAELHCRGGKSVFHSENDNYVTYMPFIVREPGFCRWDRRREGTRTSAVDGTRKRTRCWKSCVPSAKRSSLTLSHYQIDPPFTLINYMPFFEAAHSVEFACAFRTHVFTCGSEHLRHRYKQRHETTQRRSLFS